MSSFKTVVVAELKFGDVQRHVFGADLVERGDDTELEDAPKTFNRLSMDGTDNVLVLGMVNSGVRVCYVETLIADPLIGAEQADFLRDSLIHESVQGGGADVVNNASDDVALAADSASNNRFAGSGRAGFAIALVPMAVLLLSPHEGFFYFHHTAPLRFPVAHGTAAFVAHQIRRTVSLASHYA